MDQQPAIRRFFKHNNVFKIRCIEKTAGLSYKTLEHFLNKRRALSPTHQRKLINIIKRYGYEYNKGYRSLVNGLDYIDVEVCFNNSLINMDNVTLFSLYHQYGGHGIRIIVAIFLLHNTSITLSTQTLDLALTDAWSDNQADSEIMKQALMLVLNEPDNRERLLNLYG